jgi:hypothetical protein
MGRAIRSRSLWLGFLLLAWAVAPVSAQPRQKIDPKLAADLQAWEAEINAFKAWLDLVRSETYRFWLRLDSERRPHRLYVGEGFDRADYNMKELFVETFSRYLAGHPDKFMLIDLFDANGTQIGEFGWGGFKLYPNYRYANRAKPAERGSR